MAYDLLTSGSVGALSLDLGRTVPESRLLHRLTGTLARSDCMVLLMVWLPDERPSQLVINNTPSVLRLLIERKAWLCQIDDIVGYQAVVTVLKGRTGLGSRVEIDITFDGIVNGDPT